MNRFLAFIAAALLFTHPVYAASSSTTATGVMTSSTTTPIGTAVAEPVAKDTIAPSDMAPAATPTVPAIPAAPSATESKGWHPFGLFTGGSDSKSKPAQPSALTPGSSAAPASVLPPKRRGADASSETEQPKPDPEQALRGKLWTSESACKKEALKGQCIAIDCATHSGGACSDQTGTIWIYR